MKSSIPFAVGLSGVAVVVALAVAPLGGRAFGSATLPAAAHTMAVAADTITGASFGVPQTYPASGPGDTWFNTWGASGDIYATSDDTAGFSGQCNSNFAVNELTGNSPASLASDYTNCMTGFGKIGTQGNYNDGATWKTDGVISVDGTLYVAVARQVDGFGGYPVGYQKSTDASIIKSTDNGRTWSNGFGTTDDPNGAEPPPSPSGKGAEAMFPGQSFGTPVFINYGQDDNPASTADGGGTYVYAMSNDGWAYDGNYEILGRVLRSQIGNLDASDWQFYDGPAGGDGLGSANWTSDVTKATHIISAPHQLEQGGVQYLPGLHQYIFTTGYYPFNSQWPHNDQASRSTWTIYRAPHPWGPWTRFFSEPTTECYLGCNPSTASHLGLYDPVPASKFVSAGGMSDVIFGSGDYTGPARQNDNLYRLHAFPLTLTTASSRVIDESVAPCTWTGNWIVATASGGYYNDTYHAANVADATVTCTFRGTSITWVGGVNVNHGIATLSLDGGAAVPVDTYSPQSKPQQIVWQSGRLSPGTHTLTVTTTGQKDPTSSGHYTDFDYFIIGQQPGS